MLSPLYKLIITIRNFLYDKKILPIYKSNIPVISVGNITTGGTGKTPFVIFLIKHFLARKLNPLIISRGYRRSSKGQFLITSKSNLTVKTVGDEPYLISKRFPNIDIIINNKRTEAIKKAEQSNNKYDVIILDDAYQHRSVFRHLNILLINTKQEHRFLLPKGSLREPIKNINRADCIVLSKGSSLNQSMDFIAKSKIPIYSAKETFIQSNARYSEGVAFCGLGDPSSFWQTLNNLSINIVGTLEFKDHQNYTESIIQKIELLLKQTNQKTFFTTEKDWVKLPENFIKNYNGSYIKMDVTIENSAFYNLINHII